MIEVDSNQEGKVRVLVIEDQGLMRGFFERWVNTLSGFALVGSARSGEEALALLGSAQPDVAIVDLQLPGMDGLSFVRAARQVRPQLRSLVVSSLSDPLALTRVRESGVEGYVEKDGSPELLTEALMTVVQGRSYFSKKSLETLARERVRSDGLSKILSKREQQVLAHVLALKSNQEIAELMALSVRTVEFHRANLMSKLGVNNVMELYQRVQTHGWIQR
jgi:DNA-binding NarL/FixJ family response regulator